MLDRSTAGSGRAKNQRIVSIKRMTEGTTLVICMLMFVSAASDRQKARHRPDLSTGNTCPQVTFCSPGNCRPETFWVYKSTAKNLSISSSSYSTHLRPSKAMILSEPLPVQRQLKSTVQLKFTSGVVLNSLSNLATLLKLHDVLNNSSALAWNSSPFTCLATSRL
jgi:hypothetical protein